MLTPWSLVLKSLVYYRRANLALLLSAALTCMVTTGALLLGDSIKHSLNSISRNRIGQIEWVLNSGSIFFRSELATQINGTLTSRAAAIIHLPVIASSRGGQWRSNQSHVTGVDSNFFKLSPNGQALSLQPNEAFINEKCAEQLQVGINDTLTLRINDPTGLPQDAPFAPEPNVIAVRVTIKRILSKEDFGNFSLKINPSQPTNVFLNRDFLAERLQQPGRANMIVIPPVGRPPLSAAAINQALHTHWQLDDTPLKIVDHQQPTGLDLRSQDVFLPAWLNNKIAQAMPEARPIFTYFVNRLSSNEQVTPYSMVSATHKLKLATVPAGQIIISDWLADDLTIKINDTLNLSYYVIGSNRQLQTRQTSFQVKSIFPIQSLADGRSYMPDFPGLSEAGNCRDWQPGIPIDLDQIRDKDEIYWDDYRGTPKAFINLEQAQQLWGNQFGDLTAWRFVHQPRAQLADAIKQLISPFEFGISLVPIKQQSRQSAQESIDFSQLFLGLSFFMVLAGLLLIAMFFSYYVDSRQRDIMALQAIGYPRNLIIKLFFMEGLLVALLGALLGLGLSLGYNHLLLIGLKTIWFDAVRTTDLSISVQSSTIIMGLISSLLFSGLAVWLTLGRLFQRAIAAQQDHGQPLLLPGWLKPLNLGLWLLIILLIVYQLSSQSSLSIILFVGLGLLLIINSLLSLALWLNHLARSQPNQQVSRWSIGILSINRRLKESLGIITLLALGIFMVVAVSANRQNESLIARDRASGTGGYQLFATTTYPITKDLTTASGKTYFGLDQALLPETGLIPMRLHAANDASCLNIHRTLSPNIVGLNPQPFIDQQAFTFARVADEFKSHTENPWTLLHAQLEEAIPAIADQTVIQWGLGKQVGDIITVSNEQGRPIQLKLVAGLANSIFQGYVLISEENFLQLFPSNAGDQLVLVDQSSQPVSVIKQALARALINQGIAITGTAERLAEFSSVQNTYLSIFLMLGGLGLMLSTIGLAVLLARHLITRRGELALLSAIGYTKSMIKRMIMAEYVVLVLGGVLIGGTAGLVAVLPLLAVPGNQVPLLFILLVMLIITACGLASARLVAGLVLSDTLLADLREE